jgi:hypothetical protein
MRSILKRALVFVATLSLGGAAIAQSNTQDAYAADGDKQQQTQKTQQQQQKQDQQAQQEKMSIKQQAQYVQSWADSEEPTPTDQYSSNGLMLVSSALDGITQHLEKQPIGGGPAEDMTQEQRQQMQQQQQQIKQALQQIQSQHQQLKQTANQIDGTENLMQRPQHFQKGAMSVVNILDSLQQAKFNQFSDQVQQVRQSAEQIEIDKPLSAQQDNVQTFFVRTSDVLNEMASQLEQEQGAVGGGPADSEQKMQKQKESQPQ